MTTRPIVVGIRQRTLAWWLMPPEPHPPSRAHRQATAAATKARARDLLSPPSPSCSPHTDEIEGALDIQALHWQALELARTLDESDDHQPSSQRARIRELVDERRPTTGDEYDLVRHVSADTELSCRQRPRLIGERHSAEHLERLVSMADRRSRPGVRSIARANHRAEADAERLADDTRSNLDHLFERRSADAGIQRLEVDRPRRAPKFEVVSNHEVSRSSNRRPMNEAFVIAGDILSQRSEVGQRVVGDVRHP